MEASANKEPLRRRRGDGMFCWLALRMSELWDFIDRRDIDKHTVSVCIMAGTYRLTEWAMNYAALNPDKTGSEIALIITAVTGPYMLLQTAAVGFYFKSRGG